MFLCFNYIFCILKKIKHKLSEKIILPFIDATAEELGATTAAAVELPQPQRPTI